MYLPTPTEKSVLDFQKLLKENYGLDVTLHKAKDAATRFLRIHYLLNYAYSYVREGPETDAKWDRNADA